MTSQGWFRPEILHAALAPALMGFRKGMVVKVANRSTNSVYIFTHSFIPSIYSLLNQTNLVLGPGDAKSFGPRVDYHLVGPQVVNRYQNNELNGSYRYKHRVP